MHIIYGVHYNFRHRYTVNIFHFSQKTSVVAGKEKKKNPDSALLPVFIPHIGISQSEFSHLQEAGGQAVAESAVPRRSLVSPFFS